MSGTDSNAGGLVGRLDNHDGMMGMMGIIPDSYWNTTSDIIRTIGVLGGEGSNSYSENNSYPEAAKTTDELREPIDITSGIYATWADFWCDPDIGEFTNNMNSNLAQRP